MSLRLEIIRVDKNNWNPILIIYKGYWERGMQKLSDYRALYLNMNLILEISKMTFKT